MKHYFVKNKEKICELCTYNEAKFICLSTVSKCT